MKPDLLITWTKHCDYPLFRKFIKDYYWFFREIYIYFSEHNRFPYFDHFIHESLSNIDNITWIDPVITDWSKEDWRNKSTNEMLKYTNSEWVCSIEQDFFTDDWNKLLNEIKEKSNDYELIGYRGYQGQEWHQTYLQGDYVHPSFWFIKREALDKTSKDFSADQLKGCDHFGLISREAQELNMRISYIQDWGYKEFENSFHLGGVNQNYLNWDNSTYVFHRPDIFYVYNYFCRKANVAQSPEFIDLSLSIEIKLNNTKDYGLPEESKWAKFFI